MINEYQSTEKIDETAHFSFIGNENSDKAKRPSMQSDEWIMRESVARVAKSERMDKPAAKASAFLSFLAPAGAHCQELTV